MASWIDQLMEEDVLQGEGGESLLDAIKITREEYQESLEKLSNYNRSNAHDNTALDIPDDLESGGVSSTMNDREEGRASPTGSNETIIDVEPMRDPIVEEVQ